MALTARSIVAEGCFPNVRFRSRRSSEIDLAYDLAEAISSGVAVVLSKCCNAVERLLPEVD